MTLTEMAQSLGLKDAAGLRRLCAAGTLRAQKVGKTWLVSDAEVARYTREHLGKRGRPASERTDPRSPPTAFARHGEIKRVKITLIREESADPPPTWRRVIVKRGDAPGET